MAIAKTPFRTVKPDDWHRIDHTNPLCHDLVHAQVFAEPAGRSFDLTDGCLLEHENTVDRGIGSGGRFVSFPNNTSCINAGRPDKLNNMGPLTILVGARWNEGASLQMLCDKSDSDANGFRFRVNDTSLQFRTDRAGGDMLRYSSAMQAMGVLSQYSVSWDGGTSADGIRLYENDQELGYSTTLSGSGTFLDDSGNDLIIGNWTSSDPVRKWHGDIYYFYVFRRVLGKDQIADIYRAPYQFLKPRERRLFPPGGAVPVELDPGETSHDYSSDIANFNQDHTVEVSGAVHGQITELIPFAQIHEVDIFGANGSFDSAVVLFDQLHFLESTNALHAHTSAIAAFALSGELDVDDVSMAHATGEGGFTQSHDLVVQESGHNQLVDNVSLAQISGIVIAEGLHVSSADQLQIGQVHDLACLAAIHTMKADQMLMTIEGIQVPFERQVNARPRDFILQPAAHRRMINPEK